MDPSWEEGSSSSSISILSPPKWEYDVFVSFRGADTRKIFTSHLLKALEDNGYHTFRDDTELERGEYINDGLLKAIQGSRMSLIVFSKDYAGSRWCLDELVRIMNCKKIPTNQIVVPIFYDVNPSDLRKQDLGNALAKHQKEHSGEESDGGVAEKWKAALAEAARVSGHHLQNDTNGDEAAFIDKIIKDVREKVPIRLKEADHQVGLEHRVEKLIELLKMEFNGVRFVAIWGMGGIGKTTIAEKLYNRIQYMFERSGFLVEVRDTLKRYGREGLQRKLLLAMLKRTREVSSFQEGFNDIKGTAFGRKKVLLVLDDVDDVKQLKTLAINRDYFAPGSRIIITTRDRSSLKDLNLGDDEIYELKELNEDESLKLFSRHAFKVQHPPEDLLDRSRQIAHFARGLPLALEVLGSYFRKAPKCRWERSIEKLREIPYDDVQGRLKISYSSLTEQLQKLFLDMACFFVGMDQDFTVKILEGCNISAEDGILELSDRCLIKHNSSGRIVMHDMIREMGREIVKEESPEYPGKRSRLCDREDVLEVLRYGTGTEAIEGLILNGREFQVNANLLEKKMEPWYRKVWRDVMGTEVVEGRVSNFDDPKYVQVHAKAFEKMINMWLLHLDYIHLDYIHLATGYEHIFRRLLWLSWKGFPLDCIPRNFSMEKLVALNLSYSSLKKVWNGNMILPKLKFLYLSHCRYLTTTPDFSGLYSLEELWLNDCKSLVEVDESIRCLNKLLVLEMENCAELRKLPFGISMLKSLERLNLSGCSKLGSLAVSKGPLGRLAVCISSWTSPPNGVDSIGFPLAPIQASNCLTYLNLKGCNLSKLPDEIGNLISLQELILSENNLSNLPDGICNLTCLEFLELYENNVSHLPSGIGRLTSLKKLNLSRNSLCTLPDTIGKLSSLELLNLGYNNLSNLPSEIGDLKSLEDLSPGFNGFRELPESICKLDCLQDLDLDNCNLSRLPSGIGRLTSLERLNLSRNSLCTLPDTIGGLVSLHDLNVYGNNNICTIPDSISKPLCLNAIYLQNCENLRSLPKLANKTEVYAQDCPSLENVPLELDQLGKRANFLGSIKLAEQNFLTSLLKQLPKSKGLSEVQHIVDVVVPAGDQDRLEFQDRGALMFDGKMTLNICFEVPRSVKQKMLGWILRLLLWAPQNEHDIYLHINEVVCNKIIKVVGKIMSFFRECVGDIVYLMYIPQGYKGLQLEAGDKMEIPIHQLGTSPPHIVVKNWAIDLIYEGDEIHKGTDTLNQVVSI